MFSCVHAVRFAFIVRAPRSMLLLLPVLAQFRNKKFYFIRFGETTKQ